MEQPPDIALCVDKDVMHTDTPQEGLKDVDGQLLDSASMPSNMILSDDLLSDNIRGPTQ